MNQEQRNYHELKQEYWREWGFVRPDETDYQKGQREKAESKCRQLEFRVSKGTLKEALAFALVREELRNTRSPSKRPVYIAWLAKHEQWQ